MALLVVLAVGAALGLTACADDDDAGDAGSATPGAGPSGSTPDAAAADQAGQGTGDGATASDAVVDPAATGATAADGTPIATVSPTSTGGPDGQVAPPTRDLSGHDLCPVVDKAAIAELAGVAIGLAESNPSYADPNCVYYKDGAGQSVSVTRGPGDYFAAQTQATEGVDGIGEEAAWSESQSTLFVKDGDVTWIVSVFQVSEAKTSQLPVVARDIAALFVD
jgi:hypothetical protein